MTPRQFAVVAREVGPAIQVVEGQRPVFVRLALDGAEPQPVLGEIPRDTVFVVVYFEFAPGGGWVSAIEARIHHGQLLVEIEVPDAPNQVRQAATIYWKALRNRLLAGGYAVQSPMEVTGIIDMPVHYLTPHDNLRFPGQTDSTAMPHAGGRMDESFSFDLTPDEFAEQVRQMFPYVRSVVGRHQIHGAGDPDARYSLVRLVLLDNPKQDAPATVAENAKLAVAFDSLPGAWFCAIRARPIRGKLLVDVSREAPEAGIMPHEYDMEAIKAYWNALRTRLYQYMDKREQLLQATGNVPAREVAEFKNFVERQGHKDIFIQGKPQENIARGFLQAFLTRRSYREVPVRGGQTDLLAFDKDGRFLYETKIWRGCKYYEQGLREIDEYIAGEDDDGKLQAIFYLVFDPTRTGRAAGHLGGTDSTQKVHGRMVNVVVIKIAPPIPSKRA